MTSQECSITKLGHYLEPIVFHSNLMDDDAIKLNLVLAFNFAYDLDLNYADPKYIQMPRRWMRSEEHTSELQSH